MTVQACLKDHVGRLVHPSARQGAVDLLRHTFFIGSGLCISSLALGSAPLFLALGHVPGWIDAVMLAWLVLPLVAAAFVSNTGRLEAGEALSIASWLGLAWTGFLGGLCGIGATATLVAAVAIQTLATATPRVQLAAAGGAGLSILLAAGLFGMGIIGAEAGPADILMISLAAVQIALLILRGLETTRASDAAGRLDAQRYRVLSEAIGDLVLRFDRSGLVQAASGASERLFGIASPDLLGRGFFERVHVADRPAFLQAANQAATSGNSVTVNLRFRLTGFANGGGRYNDQMFAWIELRTRQFDDLRSSDHPLGAAVVAAVRDITDRVEHEAEIERAKQEAEQANASKDRFIATVSHELRTPLNAIIGFAEMLASPEFSPQDPAKRREYADIVLSSGQHLLAVVNSLLDLSKLDAGKFEICCEPFDMAELVGSCCDMVSLKAQEGQVALHREIEPGLEPIIGDRRACKQIILNLLSNALKFTPPAGHVAITAQPDGNAVIVSVTDTGIGMAARDLARLGDPFFQARGDYDRPYEGTGLGLSVVKGLVGLHGGSITVDSAPGEGTRVAVRLPLDGRRPQQAKTAKIEVITRTARSPAAVPSSIDYRKVQKIA